MDAKVPRLVEHECVVWNEEEISGRMLVHIEDTGISTTVKPRMLSPTADSITFSWACIGALSREKWAATPLL
jgi:hypothetical protein